ncbi:MAG: CsbD family protein [Candidatus Microthrix subdominans]|jgi:uncharacterized protein YjbJ (UPF0337 family)|uniref:microaggregate-binding protein 1 n=1 Tax=Candidatus Neomicrothrix sp. TaxID=2719034 RepID=UPI001B6A53F2|nr:CsbD family protein [Candidatus Microthrix sp.]MBK6309361.1 CsbD family protein [Candidatus Microthrix sp.]MBK6437798.1 CsbD family protein [Candidatus Microthrix sp.]MBK6970218.1 CsbD family protein [Candidatus Microthrix sp.]MBK7166651.1 CsbD family protein [Candidatus Microthrix sp.]MBK9561213.1 CsbD family protein [Candidatus Microthrix sp.]
MADHDDSAAEKGAKGFFEDAKGKAKEAVGSVLGNEDLKHEGEAQQDKAEAQREAAEKQAEARKADAKTEAAEARQKANQD